MPKIRRVGKAVDRRSDHGSTDFAMKDENKTLAAINLLAGLAPEVRAELEAACSWRTFRANEQIIDRQSDTQDVFFVVSGSVRVVIYSMSGREITLDDVQESVQSGPLVARLAGVVDMRHGLACAQNAERGVVEFL